MTMSLDKQGEAKLIRWPTTERKGKHANANRKPDPLGRTPWALFGNFGAWRLFLLGLSFCLSACASSLVYHSFAFDAVNESPDVYVMAYKYGNSKGPGTSDQEHEYKIGGVKHFGSRQGTSSTGDILRPDFLYVKWRIKATGEVLEDNVDLESRLPRDFSRHTVHFTVDGRQLYVYLIAWDNKKPRNCPSREERIEIAKTERPQHSLFRKYCANDIQQIYP